MRFSTLILLTLPIHIAAQSPVLQYDTLYAAQNPALAGNPALYGLRQPCSLSEISVGFSRSIFDKAAIAEQGKDCGIASFDAATYLHAGKATITGFATYANGKIFGVQGSETSDATLLYPYYSADERGGDFKHERYVFGGSYSSSFATNWIYGAELSYQAVQDYRQRDPRPKNTIGKLDVKAAIGYSLAAYDIALAAKAEKYSQNNSIIFMSELGEDKIYHTTGLGTHYTRFAGLGKEAAYKGVAFGGEISMAPKTAGVFADIAYRHFHFTKHLIELNNLPLVKSDDNGIDVAAGWQAPSWSAKIFGSHSSRKGHENIFGDPTGQVYPQIATIDAFSLSQSTAGISGLWRRLSERYRIDTHAQLSYNQLTEKYLDLRGRSFKTLTAALGAEYVASFSRIYLHLTIGTCYTKVLSHSAFGFTDEDFLSVLALQNYLTAAGDRFNIEFRPGLDYRLPKGRNIGLRLAAGYHKLKSIRGTTLQSAIIFSF